MAKRKNEQQWESTIEGKDYVFSYALVKRKHELKVNEEVIQVKQSFSSSIMGFDEPFTFDGKKARLVRAGNQMDIAYGGVFLQSKKEYVQRPAWVWVFAIACLLIPIITLGGAIPAVVGFSGALACGALSKLKCHTAIRLLLCFLVTIVAWGLLLVLGMGMWFLQG